jgi:hypothetical protein
MQRVQMQLQPQQRTGMLAAQWTLAATMLLWLQLQQVVGSMQRVCMTWPLTGLSLRLQQQRAQQMPRLLQHCSCRHGSGLRALQATQQQQLQQLLLLLLLVLR